MTNLSARESMGHLHGSLGTAAHALAAPQSPSCTLHPPTAGQAHSRAHGAHRSAAKSIATCECSVPNEIVGRVGHQNDAIPALSCHLPARTEQRQAVPWAHKIVRRVSEERSGRAAWDRSRKGGIGKWMGPKGAGTSAWGGAPSTCLPLGG